MNPRKKYSQFIKVSPLESSKVTVSSNTLIGSSKEIKFIPTKTTFLSMSKFKSKPIERLLMNKQEDNVQDQNEIISERAAKIAKQILLSNEYSSEESMDNTISQGNYYSNILDLEEVESIHENDLKTLDDVIPQKKDVIIKGPRALSSIYEDKPAPKWPKQMDTALLSPNVSFRGNYVDFEEKFEPKNAIVDPPDFSQVVTEIVYQADFSKINVRIYYKR